MSGIYNSDSVRDVADSLGLQNLAENVVSLLASDVEYRLHQIIEEAARFTRHSKRTVLTPSDVDQAFRILNIEPVYGHSLASAPTFKRIIPAIGPPIYSINDEEIDFERIVKEEEIPVPRAVSYTAHWLAIEGVQPLIPENPPPPSVPTSAAHNRPPAPTQAPNQATPKSPTNAPNATNKPHPLTKSHLSRELQQYYARLTDSMSMSTLDPQDRQSERKRNAALASLRNDAGLQGILPYLVRWIGDCVVNALSPKSSAPGDVDDGMSEDDVDRATLDMILEVINAILDNQRLFVEPYLHTILPPLLSILLTSTLSASSSYSSIPSHPPPTPRALRSHAAHLLAYLLKLYSPSYPSVSTKVTKTLILALLSDRAPIQPSDDAEARFQALSLGTKEGALRGLTGVGNEAVYRGLIAGKTARALGEEIERRVGARDGTRDVDDPMAGLGIPGSTTTEDQTWTEEVRDVVDAYMMALNTIHPQSSGTTTKGPDPETARLQLTDVLGPFMASWVIRRDSQWALGLATILAERERAGPRNPEGNHPPNQGSDSQTIAVLNAPSFDDLMGENHGEPAP